MPFPHNAPIRIIIADDHPTVRDGLTRLLETNADLKVIGAACDGEEAVRLVTTYEPDLLLLDVTMPRMSGLVALRALHGPSRRLRRGRRAGGPEPAVPAPAEGARPAARRKAQWPAAGGRGWGGGGAPRAF